MLRRVSTSTATAAAAGYYHAPPVADYADFYDYNIVIEQSPSHRRQSEAATGFADVAGYSSWDYFEGTFPADDEQIIMNNSTAVPIPVALSRSSDSEASDLDVLALVEYVVARRCQSATLKEVFLPYLPVDNCFELVSALGHPLYYAVEVNEGCGRGCFGSHRPFSILILSIEGDELISINADADCFGQEAVVQYPPGRTLATIEKEFSFFSFTPTFYVRDRGSGKYFYKVQRSFDAAFGRKCEVDFDIISAMDNTTVVGKFSKKMASSIRRHSQDKNIFTVKFPHDLDLEWKVVLLGVLFHLEYSFYSR